MRRIAIVGAGPSGFYTAKYLLEKNASLLIDIVEKLPVPYGLVRFGVAPDHQEVKGVVDTFKQILSHERVRYLGGVEVGGKGVSLEQLRNSYSGVVLAYGASSDVDLNIPDEHNIKNILPARRFVGWYNGDPDCVNVGNEINLDQVKNVVIVGNGNVAIDCARILSKNIDELHPTDITSSAISMLKKSNIENIYIIGRRGHVQASFTIKEFRELTKLSMTKVHIDKGELVRGLTDASAKEIENNRPKTRIVELINTVAAAGDAPTETFKNIFFKFLMTPTSFLSENNSGSRSISGIKCERNKLVGDPFHQKAVGTGAHEVIQCQLVLKSIGYKSLPIESSIFNSRSNTINHINGRVVDINSKQVVEGLYTVGWVKRGPTGIIGTNITDAKDTMKAIIDDIEAGLIKEVAVNEMPLLNAITLDKYEKINSEEVKRGENTTPTPKIREKITSIEEMVKIANS